MKQNNVTWKLEDGVLTVAVEGGLCSFLSQEDKTRVRKIARIYNISATLYLKNKR
jgi:hypothetical protein